MPPQEPPRALRDLFKGQTLYKQTPDQPPKRPTSIILYYIIYVLHYIILYYIVLYYVILYYIILLYYIIFYYIIYMGVRH